MVSLPTSADPVAAERAIELVAASGDGPASRLASDRRLRSVLTTVAGASPWLARVCVAYPDAALDVLAGFDDPEHPARRLCSPDPPGPDRLPGATESFGVNPQSVLSRAKRLGILGIAARDLLGLSRLEDVGAELSGLAAALLQAALREAYSLTSGEVPAAELAIIGMGKLGAGELNYASDVDLLLVTANGAGAPLEPRLFLDLGRAAWRVDLDLRPEGRSGSLTRSIASYQTYWRRWADVWEFQALIKARPVAGDPDLGRDFAEAAAEQLWERPIGADDLRRLRELKAKSEMALQRRGLSDRELKRGPGGIRDIEFALQLLQLVHGHADPTIRVASTLDAVAALAGGGYIAPDDARSLEDAYRFLRTVEHRLQLYEGEQAHALPTSPPRREHLARVLGYRARGSVSAAEQLDAALRRHRSAARGIHERLFFRPLLEVFNPPGGPLGAAGRRAGLPAALDAGEERDGAATTALGEEAVAVRLAAFGFTDAARTRQAATELTRGFSRVSRLMQQTLPLLLDWLSETPDPDGGLLGLRTLAGEPHSRDRLVAVCRESPNGARQLCRLLGTTGRFTRDFQRHPEMLGELARGQFLGTPTSEELGARVESSLAWRPGDGGLEVGLRAFVEGERLRIAARDVLGVADPGPALSNLADAVLGAALRRVECPVPLAVIGMGRLGGRELGHGSDLDLLFVHDAPPGVNTADATAAAEAAVAALIRLVAGTTPATGAYRIDLALRPEGRQGPTVRSLDSYAAYYARWAEPWERQALLRGRFVTGDTAVGSRFAGIAAAFIRGREMTADDIVEIRRTKARIERERVPAGDDPKFHLKLGPGSLSDVEWTTQLLQLEHGVESEGTINALRALAETGAVSVEDERILAEAYLFCDRARNRLSLIRGLPTDSLPAAGPLLSVLARSLGRSTSELRNEYARTTRRARRVVERLFYGKKNA